MALHCDGYLISDLLLRLWLFLLLVLAFLQLSFLAPEGGLHDSLTQAKRLHKCVWLANVPAVTAKINVRTSSAPCLSCRRPGSLLVMLTAVLLYLEEEEEEKFSVTQKSNNRRRTLREGFFVSHFYDPLRIHYRFYWRINAKLIVLKPHKSITIIKLHRRMVVKLFAILIFTGLASPKKAIWLWCDWDIPTLRSHLHKWSPGPVKHKQSRREKIRNTLIDV